MKNHIYFANEALEREEILWANQAITAVRPGDNHVQLAPYGKFPNAAGMQVFTKSDAQTICHDFASKSGNGVRALGIPFYIGHPDHDSFKDRYTDTKAYGRIKSLRASDTGLVGNVQWSPAGKQLIEDQAFHGHSVNWRMNKIGGEWHPVSLKSVGFTNEPNIPVSPILVANESKTTPPNDGAPPWVLFARRQEKIQELMDAVGRKYPHFSYDQKWQWVNKANPDLFSKPLSELT